MAQRAADKERKKSERSYALFNGVAAFFVALILTFGGYQAIVHPDTPLPRQWNPTETLVVSDPVTPLTGWKLNRAAASFDQCLAVLTEAAALRALAPLEDSEQCFIRDRIDLRAIGDASLAPIETRCATALRLAMWEEHSLQPAAADTFGARVTRIDHIGSYNCRVMRTSSGPSTRMSTHATADAIDIAGFSLSDGTQIRLLSDWDGLSAEATFLRAARDGACDWFGLTLSPDFNRLHADHFHLQNRGWGSCR